LYGPHSSILGPSSLRGKPAGSEPTSPSPSPHGGVGCAPDPVKEEFASGLCDGDLHDLLLSAVKDGFRFRGSYADWLYGVGFFEDTRYVRLPEGVNQYELDEWLRSKYGKGLDEDG
jgi:hypothetical protein